MADLQPEALAPEFHVASRNPAAFKRMFKAHEVHYDPFVQQLVALAPLSLPDYQRVALPPSVPVSMPVDEAIGQRVSGRDFQEQALPLDQLATLLRLGNAVRQTNSSGGGVLYQRNAPNSGGLGSVEVYPIVLNVEGLEPGVYHFDTIRHDLAQLYRGQFRTWVRELVLFQTEFSRASVALVITAAIGRLSAKYGPRGYRFALLDVGHVSENIYLVATGLGLQVCATAGFIDDELDRVLGLDGIDVASMLVLLVGTSP